MSNIYSIVTAIPSIASFNITRSTNKIFSEPYSKNVTNLMKNPNKYELTPPIILKKTINNKFDR